jgi:hypothetical protein
MSKRYPHHFWTFFTKQPQFAGRFPPLLGPDTRIFTMGSCFAAELRDALRRTGTEAYPRYRDINPVSGKHLVVSDPPPDWTNHYHTFAIRQEFELALGVLKRPPDIVIEVQNKEANRILNAPVVYQDPMRLSIFATSREELEILSTKIDQIIREGIETADVLVITLGLTEIFRHRQTGLVYAKAPETGIGGGAHADTKFTQSTFAQNYENVRAVIDLVLARYPEKKIVISVSPVPLGVTFSDTDIATANTESKSILRTVAGQIAREYPASVSYFPSYEMATALPIAVFQEDRRHVLPEFADKVVRTFRELFAKR